MNLMVYPYFPEVNLKYEKVPTSRHFLYKLFKKEVVAKFIYKHLK